MVEEIVHLNVGGRFFVTTLTTLGSEPGSALSRMFTRPDELPAIDTGGRFIIDSSPDLFGPVLDWCRYKSLIASSDCDLGGLATVADYFGLPGLAAEATNRQAAVEAGRAETISRVEARLARVEARLASLEEQGGGHPESRPWRPTSRLYGPGPFGKFYF
jgi:hypothetical protein